MRASRACSVARFGRRSRAPCGPRRRRTSTALRHTRGRTRSVLRRAQIRAVLPNSAQFCAKSPFFSLRKKYISPIVSSYLSSEELEHRLRPPTRLLERLPQHGDVDRRQRVRQECERLVRRRRAARRSRRRRRRRRRLCAKPQLDAELATVARRSLGWRFRRPLLKRIASCCAAQRADARGTATSMAARTGRRAARPLHEYGSARCSSSARAPPGCRRRRRRPSPSPSPPPSPSTLSRRSSNRGRGCRHRLVYRVAVRARDAAEDGAARRNRRAHLDHVHLARVARPQVAPVGPPAAAGRHRPQPREATRDVERADGGRRERGPGGGGGGGSRRLHRLVRRAALQPQLIPQRRQRRRRRPHRCASKRASGGAVVTLTRYRRRAAASTAHSAPPSRPRAAAASTAAAAASPPT